MDTQEKRVCSCIVKRQATLNAPKLLRKIQLCQGQQLLLVKAPLLTRWLSCVVLQQLFPFSMFYNIQHPGKS